MQPAQNSKLPDLGSTNSTSPSFERSFTVSDPNLKPAEVNLPPIQPQAPSINQATVAAPQPFAGNQVATTPAVSDTNQVFVNPNPPQPPLTADPNSQYNPNFAQQPPSSINAQIPNADDLPNNRPFPKLPIGKNVLVIILVSILLIAGAGFGVNEFFINRISSLSLVSEDSQYYLSLAVKKAPQAEATKSLVKKFPSGERLLKQFDKYYTNYIADDKKDPLVDLTQYSTDELLFSRISRANSPDDYSRHLLTIIGTESTEKAKGAFSNFEDDKATYATTKTTVADSQVYELSLQSEKKLYEEQLNRKKSVRTSLATPKPKKLYATNIENFLVASDQKDDIKKTIELSKSTSIFGFKDSSQPKSILDTEDHKKLASYFPKENFLKFFQRDPITPYNTQTPFFSNSVDTSSQSPTSEAKTFQKISRALTVEVKDSGASLQSLQIDIPEVAKPASDYSVSDSLANKLPKQFSNVAPTWFAETKNLKDQYRYLDNVAEQMKDSKSRTQREEFESYLKSKNTAKSSYKKAYGIDFEKDILDWLTGQVAIILNAGSAKKGPELLVFAEISDMKKVEDALKQITIPDSQAQLHDARRKSDLRSIVTALETYYIDNSIYPNALSALQTNGSYGSYLRTIPKDPVTGQSYNYSVKSGGSNFTLSAQLDDGQTISFTASGSSTYSGTKKDPVIKPVATAYNGVNVYTMKLYSYQNISYSLFFTVTDKLAMLGFSDSDSSYKQLIDFQKNPGEKLSQNTEFKSQFDSVKDKVVGLSFIEPINIWGFIEYLEANYPEYKQAASSYSGANSSYLDDLEKATKGFLKTVPSIGTYGTNKDQVSQTKTLLKVKELPSNEKKIAEDALDRLLSADENNDYRSVLGVNTQTFSEKVKATIGTFYNEKVRAFVSPELLPN